MTWTRLDDSWTDRRELTEVSYGARWHMLALIQMCCRVGQFDGILRASDARRCSDVDTPEAAIDELATAGLVERLPDGRVRVVGIEDHVPPPHVRRSTEQARERQRRSRAHKAGNHELCLPANCADAPVTQMSRVTSGRDGTGRGDLHEKNQERASPRERDEAPDERAARKALGSPRAELEFRQSLDGVRVRPLDPNDAIPPRPLDDEDAAMMANEGVVGSRVRPLRAVNDPT
ncbi:hypothetical protein [Tsukamurella strandjordii]|uniref:Uncharacterized protein n=1 Tax=Tsukamurella strandjordii TaxID=147577 RepID=A0AA90SM55_9ACTN|nr:hypothetical protein [Tsukamurella strandjordii]MDP0398932.1 hypothetical protein [Tsukamurella strandjordii]